MTPAVIRQAIATVSQWAEDVSADRAEADRITDAVRELARPALYELLAAAGLDGIRSGDAKGYLLTRLHTRLTARIRARERAEV
jgi:hypothetical protein